MASTLITFGMLVLIYGTVLACIGMLRMGTAQQRRHVLAEQHNKRLEATKSDLLDAIAVGGPEPESSKTLPMDNQFNDIANSELLAAARPNKMVFIGWSNMALGATITVVGHLI